MDSKKVIEKLFKIAQNQQKLILKLAQGQDPNVAYLQRVAEVAAVNLNAGGPVSVKVSANAAQSLSDPGVSTHAGYTVKVSGLNNDKLKNQFKMNLDSALKDRTDLLENLNIIYV